MQDYSEHVNPQWVNLLNLLQMNSTYVRCQGTELFTLDGRVILDYLSGYCVHNTGHNHPAIIAELHQELDKYGPAMLQSHVPDLSAELAKRLCRLAGGRLNKVFFTSSGSEGVEAAIKFSRATTGRNGVLYVQSAFHGLTCGALSLMDSEFWRAKFGPMLADTVALPFGDLEALKEKLATKKFGAFVVEAVQSEAGIKLPEQGYLRAARELCTKYGAMLVVDEVQTGMFRTGRFLASQHFDTAAGPVDPDMVILAKALSGGLVPVGAILMTDKVYSSVFDSLKRSMVHASTFSENSLSMRAGLATLDVLESENLGERALALGEYLRGRLKEELSGYEMIKDVRGAGLLSGIEFQAPKSMSLRVPFEAFRMIHPGMFGQVLVMRMYRDHKILTQICGNNFLVLKVAPPLTVSGEQLDAFIAAAKAVVELAHSSNEFWGEALGLARRAINV